nr:hypothetical protein [Tanacetum cinerariifolium]
MGDAHLYTILVTESNEFIKSSVENLVPNLSESEGEYECDVPVFKVFTTFSNILFDADYDFSSNDDQSFSDEDILKEIYSNPLLDEEIISIKIDPHHFNAESDLIESLLNHDSSIISSSSKIDSLFDEFANVKVMGGISEHKVPMPRLMFTQPTLVPNQEKSPDLLSHWGHEAFQLSAECPMMIYGKNTPILDVLFFHFYPP